MAHNTTLHSNSYVAASSERCIWASENIDATHDWLVDVSKEFKILAIDVYKNCERQEKHSVSDR